MEDLKTKALERAKKADVKFIYLEFTDVVGVQKNVTIPIEQLEESLEHGTWFDGSSVEGFTRICESDMVLRPDPSTFALIPWRPKEKATARMIADIYTPQMKPFEGDPRYILKKTLAEAEEGGYYFNTGPELEFFLFKKEDGKLSTTTHDSAGYFDATPKDLASDVRRDIILAMEEMGLYVEMSHHEVAPGQHEIDFRYDYALKTADNAMTFKHIVKAMAHSHGLHATFMPKPIHGINGSGMHVHQSFFDKKGDNLFYDDTDEYNLSSLARHFIAGQLENIRGISAVLAPTVNSYKRLVPGYEAPVYICWARKNRSSLIRVPSFSPGRKKSVRAELRCPDPSCNPYLAFAVMLKAGMDGIKKKLEPPAPVEEDVYEFDDDKLEKFYIKTLPGSLKEALDEFKKCKVGKEALGEHAYEYFLRSKKAEWDAYRMQVSQWELDTYLDRL